MTKKVALITGAGQGIGEGIARQLATDGFDVALSGRHLDKVQRVADDINKNGGNALQFSLMFNIKTKFLTL